MSGAAIIAGLGFSFIPHLSALASVVRSSSSGTATLGLAFKGGGQLIEYYSPFGGGPTETVRPREWCIPSTVFGGAFNPGPGFELFTDLNSGTLFDGNSFLGGWFNLGTFAPQFSIQRTGFGFTTATLTFQIRSAISHVILASGTYELDLILPP